MEEKNNNRVNHTLLSTSINGDIESVISFLENEDNDMEDLHLSLRLSASGENNIEIVRLLLENGANVNSGNDEAFRLASRYGCLETVELLLDYGANIHAQDDESLRMASKNGHIEIVRLLLENQADIHAGNNDALLSASEKGYTEIVKLLLENGANVQS